VYFCEKFIDIEFTCSICYTCGFYDYFDDFRYELLDLGLNTRIESIEAFEEGAIVRFVILGYNP